MSHTQLIKDTLNILDLNMSTAPLKCRKGGADVFLDLF